MPTCSSSSEVPPERLERLYTAAGTTAGGLVFPPAVLTALRRGFVERRSEEEQRTVLAFLLKAIKAAEPQDKVRSPAHLAWKWRYERVRLESEPDAALESLSALAAGPLGPAIRAELGRVVAPERVGPDVVDAAIPLRALPGTRRGLQRLLALAENCGVSRREAYPMGWGHTVAVSACGFGGVALAAAAVWLYVHTGIELLVKVAPTDQPFGIALERRGPEGWKPEQVFTDRDQGAPTQASQETAARDLRLDPGAAYRLSVFAQGQVARRELDAVSQTLRIGFDSPGSLLSCTETSPELGLSVERCPPGSEGTLKIAPWVQSPDAREIGRLMSLGLEVRAGAGEYPALDRLSAALLETGSLDRLYRVRPRTNGKVHLTEVFDRIEADFGPWLAKSQLIGWSAGGEGLDLAGLAPDRRALILGQGAAVSWVQPLLNLLSSKTTPVTEAEVLQAVKTAKATGPGAPVLLLTSGRHRTVGPPPGTVFRDPLKDGSQAPAMVVVPAGTFPMGGDGAGEERPVHPVEFTAPFALGQFEVTVGEFRRFVESSGYRTEAERRKGSSGQLGCGKDVNWRKPGFEQDDRHPVVCVSWNDARAYAQWLSRQSGCRYRLPTEAEWEYAARAGTKTNYWWGDDIGRNQANCSTCRSRWDDKSTAPTGSFAANSFKIWDSTGNAREWVEDCWHPGYNGAPPDGSAWTVGACARRVLRGGSWSRDAWNARAATRYPAGDPNDDLGFRLARTL